METHVLAQVCSKKPNQSSHFYENFFFYDDEEENFTLRSCLTTKKIFLLILKNAVSCKNERKLLRKNFKV